MKSYFTVNTGPAFQFRGRVTIVRMDRREFLPLIFASALAAPKAAAATDLDWPQWRGPERTGLSKETGLEKVWPAGGPKKIWSVEGLGDGYGSLAIVKDRIFVQGGKGKDSVVACLSRADGKTLWTKALGQRLDQDRGGGPRGTPTVDGDLLYALSESGDLQCLRTADGASVWRKNMLRDFHGENAHWLISESPLVDGNKLVITPGGSGAGIVALDKMTGKDIWMAKELRDPAGYSSCIAIEVDGVRAYTTLTARSAAGVRASDGKLLWRYERVANRTANVATPIYFDKKVFYSSAYGTGCALLSLKAANGELRADEVYFNREMMNHHGGVLLVDGYLYGFSNAILTCMEFATGKVMWKDRSVGKGSLTYADGKLFLFGEQNTVGLAAASPKGYQESGRFSIPDQGFPSWAHPVVSGGRLYIRNQNMLMCYDVRAPLSSSTANVELR
ncbi:MAG: PQQ-binding-like beta-propeller repeat protein [Bryobacteraceae bacterium]|nr:PQQ-binding-like beta-propeller repeat protein [Bryobacteraceae bacterium]